jgi:hypothetical protein
MKKRSDKKSLLTLVRAVSKMKPEEIPNALDMISDKGVHGISECVYNVIFNDLKIGKKKRNILKKKIGEKCSIHKLRKIVTKGPISKRRRYLKQQGGVLPLILGAAIPFLANLIFGSK